MTEENNSGSKQQSDRILLRRMLGLVLVYRWRCLWIVFLQVVLLALGLLSLSAAGLGVDIIRCRDNPDQLGLPLGLHAPAAWSVMHLLCVTGAGILTLAVILLLLQYYTRMLSARLVQDMMVRLRSDIYAKLQHLGFSFYDSHMTGSIINRVTSDAMMIRVFMEEVVIEGITLVLTLSISFAYMFHIHPALTMACLATTPLLAGATFIYTRKVRPAMMKSRELYDRLILILSENVQGVHVVKGFTREPREVAKFDEANRNVRDQQRWLFKISSFYNASTGMLSHLNITILIGFGGYLVMHNQLALGAGLLVFYGLLGQFSNQVSNLASIANRLQMSFTGARRVFEVLDMPVEIASKTKPIRLQRVRGAVEFNNVTFGYDPGKPVLSGVSFKVEPGQSVAVVGPTGSGKSTLLSLIPRFYDPQQGRVLIDGVDVRDLHIDDLRRNIGFVFQENFLFSNTVSANIAFGRPDSPAEKITAAAGIASAHNFIKELIHEYDTIVGERGVGLSGGQRQRIALARAILLEPAILILDDPTAAIDPQTEHEIQIALDSVMSGRTTLIVSHRLSTLRRADRIIVIEDGRIVQTGTHKELMETPGHYRNMADIQIHPVHRKPGPEPDRYVPEEVSETGNIQESLD